uniref:Reverse transcriptase domain-containing protein n=1 Tax=Angiostrongylus cantonensis TaxID=6313 RepID=A0A0K0DQC2_ANGCA
MGVKIDGGQLYHLPFGDDIILITPRIGKSERMLADFDKAYGKIGLRLNLTKTMFMKNKLVSYVSLTLDRTNISQCSSYVCLGRRINMMNELAPELSRRKRAAWGALEEHRGCSEENKEHPTPCLPFRLNGSSCPNICVKNLIAA